MVAPFSAVTRTVKALSPTRRPDPPEITTDARESVASATTTALVATGSTVTTPLTALTPFTVKVFREVSVEIGRTFKVTV